MPAGNFASAQIHQPATTRIKTVRPAHATATGRQVRIQSVDMDSGRMSLSMREGFGGGGGGSRPPSDVSAFADVATDTWRLGLRWKRGKNGREAMGLDL